MRIFICMCIICVYTVSFIYEHYNQILPNFTSVMFEGKSNQGIE